MTKRQGFTLVEILVVIALIILLLAILLPALSSARRQEQKLHCMANLRQIGMAFRMYALDHDDHYPLGVYADGGNVRQTIYWQLPLRPYIRDDRLFFCPSARETQRYDIAYGISPWVMNWNWSASQDAFPQPARTVICAEKEDTNWAVTPPSWTSEHGWPVQMAFRHGGTAILLFADGHVESQPLPAVEGPTAIWHWEANQ